VRSIKKESKLQHQTKIPNKKPPPCERGLLRFLTTITRR